MTKAEARKKYKALRSELTSAEIAQRSLAIANHALQMPIWSYSFYHIFLSINQQKEVDTQPLLNILLGKDKNIVVSRIRENDNSLDHFLLQDQTKLILNAWGVPEPVSGIIIQPEQLDVIFVPLLAFDIMGNRIGYGKGFYDRFLAQCRPDALKIGLSLFEPDSSILSTNDTDISLNYCISSKKVYNF